MKKLLILLFLASPIILAVINNYFFNSEKVVYTDSRTSIYYGERRGGDGNYYIRGVVSSINKKDRILTLITQGDSLSDFFVNKDAEFDLLLKLSKGGEGKKYKGDYFVKINPGDSVDMELLGKNSKFVKTVLVYGLESFSL